MAGLTEIYNSILSGIATTGKLQAAIPKAGGNVYAINNLSTSPTQVIAASSGRSNLSFHFPQETGPYLWVAPATASSSGTYTPGPGALGGSYLILPGADRTLTGPAVNSITGAWLGWVSSGTGIPLTVSDQ